jgi:tetratricopeptide (TPR) repeat protein
MLRTFEGEAEDVCRSMRNSNQLAVVPSIFVALVTLLNSGCQMAADGHNLDGVRLYQQGHYSPAMQRFQEALAKNPENADAYYNMAATMHKIGVQSNDDEALVQAETLYNQCLDIDENHVDCHRGLAVLLVETDRSDRGFKLMKNWALASPEVADARIELARLYQEFGDYAAASEHLNYALKIDQQSHRTWAALGQLRERTGEYDQALANYQRSFQLNQQQAIGERIAALNQSMSTLGTPAVGNTRTVSAPMGPRY